MEGQCDHGPHFIQLDMHHAIIGGRLLLGQGLVLRHTAMAVQPIFDDFVCLPDGGKTGGFRSHYIDAKTIIHIQRGYTGPHKLQYFVFYKSAFENRLNQSQCYVLRADARLGFAGQVYGDDLRIF